MSDETIPEGQFEHSLLNRDMRFHTLTHGQLTLMRQRLNIYNKTIADLPLESTQASELTHDLNLFLLKVVNSRFVNDTDRDDVADSILEGRTSIMEVLAVIGFGKKTETVEDDAPPPAPKRVAKKAARRTANPVRAKK